MEEQVEKFHEPGKYCLYTMHIISSEKEINHGKMGPWFLQKKNCILVQSLRKMHFVIAIRNAQLFTPY